MAIRTKRPAIATPAAMSSVFTEAMNAMPESTRSTAMPRVVVTVLLFRILEASNFHILVPNN